MEKSTFKLRLFIFALVLTFGFLFLAYIIYYYFTKNDSLFLNSNVFNINQSDPDFVNNTSSFMFIDSDEPYNRNVISSYNQNRESYAIQTKFSGLKPAYQDDKLVTTFYINNSKNSSDIYVYDSLSDFDKDSDSVYTINEDGIHLNHEHIYDFESNYIFAIDNLNDWKGQDTNDNKGLGLPSVQEIDVINLTNNQSKIINVPNDLLGYDNDVWYDEDYHRTIMPSNDLFHFNSLDFDGQNLYANSRTLGAVFSIKVLDDNLNILQNPTINWIYSGNFATYYYLFGEDLNGDHPLKYNPNPKENAGYYIQNPNYNPQEIFDFNLSNGGISNKFISWEIDGQNYNINNLNTLINVQKENEEELFMGEHDVKYLNNYIEELGPENLFVDGSNSYDSNDIYLSMFDNHDEYNLDHKPVTSTEIQEIELGEDYPKFKDDINSYIKIVEINPTSDISKTNLAPMTGRVILNHKTEQKSEIVSDVMFFNEDNQNYVAVDQGKIYNGKPPRYTIYQFDKIDTEVGDFNSYKIAFDATFTDASILFRIYPFWFNLSDSNVIVSWKS